MSARESGAGRYTIQVLGADELQARLAAIISTTGQSAMMKELGNEIVRRAKKRAPRKTGNLGRSIAVADHSPEHVRVDARATYAGYVEFGTKDHDIKARRAKALRWATGKGGSRLSGSPRRGAKVAFAKWVHHPGTDPQPFLVPAAREAAEDSGLIKGDIIERWNGAG